MKIESAKFHIFATNPNMVAIHTTRRILHGNTVELEGIGYRVKEVVKDQESRYYPKHNYYEIKI